MDRQEIEELGALEKTIKLLGRCEHPAYSDCISCREDDADLREKKARYEFLRQKARREGYLSSQSA